MTKGRKKTQKTNYRLSIQSKIPKNISKELEKKGESALSDLPFRKLILLSIIINVLMIIFAFYSQGYLPPIIPMYYGLPESSEQLASSMTLMLPAALSLSICIINSTIAALIKDDFLKKALVIAALTATFFSTIAIIKIVLLVGSL